MGLLDGRWRFQGAAVEGRILDLAIGLDFGAFAVEDAHDVKGKRGGMVGRG